MFHYNVLFFYIFITKFKPTTSTKRNNKRLFLIKFFKLNKFFRFLCKNNSGRNNSGKITVFSKGKKKRINTVVLSKFKSSFFRNLSTTVSIFRVKKKLFNLNLYSTGSFFLKPAVYGSSLGVINFTSVLPKNFWPSNTPGNYVLLKHLSKYFIFSNVLTQFGRKYALSNGTFCQVLDFFRDFNLIKIALPSKQVKYVSGWNFVISGRNSQIEHRHSFFGKAGFNINAGIKPKVRGVARNPVDHPHGGRTKTNQPEVSIWGWIAKKNK